MQDLMQYLLYLCSLNTDGLSPLTVAVLSNNRSLTKMLLQHGAVEGNKCMCFRFSFLFSCDFIRQMFIVLFWSLCLVTNCVCMVIQLNHPIRWVTIWIICCVKLKIAFRNWAVWMTLRRHRSVPEHHFPVLLVSFYIRIVFFSLLVEFVFLYFRWTRIRIYICTFYSQGHFQFSIILTC